MFAYPAHLLRRDGRKIPNHPKERYAHPNHWSPSSSSSGILVSNRTRDAPTKNVEMGSEFQHVHIDGAQWLLVNSHPAHEADFHLIRNFAFKDEVSAGSSQHNGSVGAWQGVRPFLWRNIILLRSRDKVAGCGDREREWRSPKGGQLGHGNGNHEPPIFLSLPVQTEKLHRTTDPASSARTYRRGVGAPRETQPEPMNGDRTPTASRKPRASCAAEAERA
ncbi:hypothetical protein K438DRAFT_1752670 [Mycena galopus ATCC 62051]|nr:hypothetical protein K438DRAFT_1752670 [Mycena galopus ATCC 62051]